MEISLGTSPWVSLASRSDSQPESRTGAGKSSASGARRRKPVRVEPEPEPEPESEDRLPPGGRLRIFVALVVTAVWAGSFIADVTLQDRYDPSIYIHGAMLMVIGSLFGVEVWGRK